MENATLTPEQIVPLKAAYAQAKATERKGFHTGDLPMEAMGHGEAKGIRDTMATLLGIDPADAVEVLNAP